jgi:hypothetical protein
LKACADAGVAGAAGQQGQAIDQLTIQVPFVGSKFINQRQSGLYRERARPLTSLKKLVASKFLGYETKPDGATEHQTDR